MSEYKLQRFEKSKRKNKKYDAIIKNRKGDVKRIPFGDVRYEQYKDSTPNKLYSGKDHNDKKRRDAYRKRHKIHLKNNFFSPAYFSWHYLW